MDELSTRPPDGISFIESEEDRPMTEIEVWMSGPDETPYQGGRFRVKLLLSPDHPHMPPRGFFLTRIFHPNVASDGAICVSALKKDWTATTTIAYVFQVIRCLLIVPFPESSLNDEAGKLFMESFEDFAQRARLMTAVHAMAGGGAAAAAAAAAVPLPPASAIGSAATAAAGVTSAADENAWEGGAGEGGKGAAVDGKSVGSGGGGSGMEGVRSPMGKRATQDGAAKPGKAKDARKKGLRRL
ncbi:unnamed protein product [Phaeothamnion confervicola]